MFAVIYRFKLQLHQEEAYKTYWRTIAEYFVEKRGAIGSTLHKTDDGVWLAYSRWPDKATRDAAWPGDDAPSGELPDHIRETIRKMQAFKKENAGLEKYDEICMDVVDDLLL